MRRILLQVRYMTAAEEEFVHYVECIDSLNRAWRILQDLGAEEPPSRPCALRWAAFRFALIEYAKPYTRSDGHHRRRRLPSPDLSPELLAVHVRLLDLRNHVLAHNDLTLKEARLHVAMIADEPHCVISSNTAEILPSREDVLNLIERTLDQMYVEVDRRKRRLRITI